MSAMNAVDHRTDELKTIAKQEELAKLGFDTVLFDVQTLSSADLVKTLEAKHINIDEMHYTDVHAIIAAQKETNCSERHGCRRWQGARDICTNETLPATAHPQLHALRD